MTVRIGAGEFFEEVGVLDGGGDFVVAAGPLAEVDAAAAVGAEREVFASCENDIAAGGAAECLDLRGGILRHGTSLILFGWATKFDGRLFRRPMIGVPYVEVREFLAEDLCRGKRRFAACVVFGFGGGGGDWAEESGDSRTAAAASGCDVAGANRANAAFGEVKGGNCDRGEDDAAGSGFGDGVPETRGNRSRRGCYLDRGRRDGGASVCAGDSF